jgi:transcriptional regulator with XRE-family HTH domain
MADEQAVRGEGFANLVRGARQRLGWSQQTLAERSGLPEDLIRAWEDGALHATEPTSLLRSVLVTLDIEPADALVALGYLTPDDLRDRPSGRVDESIRLDAETRDLLTQLALTSHSTPERYLASLIVADYDRQWPGRRDFQQIPLEARLQRVRELLGQTELLDDPEAERRLDQALARAQEEALRIYGGPDQAAA